MDVVKVTIQVVVAAPGQLPLLIDIVEVTIQVVVAAPDQFLLLTVRLELQSFAVVARSQVLLTVGLELKFLAEVVIQVTAVARCLFLLGVHLELKSFADSHIVRLLDIMEVTIQVVAAVPDQFLLLTVRLELQSFAVVARSQVLLLLMVGLELKFLAEVVIQVIAVPQCLFLLGVRLELQTFVDSHIVHLLDVVKVTIQVVAAAPDQFLLLTIRLELKSFAVVAHSQVPFLLRVCLGLESLAEVVIQVKVVIQVIAVARCHFLLSVGLESKSFADSHIVHPVVLLSAITLLIALHAATILEVDFQNVIVAFELHSTTAAVGTLQNIDAPCIAIPTCPPDGITPFLQNVDLPGMRGIDSLIPLKLILLVMCLYPLAVPLVPFLDAHEVNLLFLDLFMCHQQLAERPRLIRHRLPFIDLWTSHSVDQSLYKCHHVLKPLYIAAHCRVYRLTKKPVLTPLQSVILVNDLRIQACFIFFNKI